MSVNVPKKYSQEELLKGFPKESHEIIFICREIYYTDDYTQAVLLQVVYGDIVLTPQMIFEKNDLYILHIDSNAFSYHKGLLYDGTCVFSYDILNKYFRYGHQTTNENVTFWIEEHARIE